MLNCCSIDHNLGMISNKIFDTLEEAYNNKVTSYTIPFGVFIENNQMKLSIFSREFIPLLGNRLSKINDNEYYYLIVDDDAVITSQIRI